VQTLKRIQTIAQTDDDFDTIWFKTIDDWKQQLIDDNRVESPEKRQRREILNDTYDLLQEHCRLLRKLNKAGRTEEVKRNREHTMQRIRAIAPTDDDFDTVWFKTINDWKQQRADDINRDKRNERRRVKRKTDRTEGGSA